ncbi:hypothetical protein RND81_05G105100 [Saponaria officinalis]|uniref:Uncharacterized protein n=1 Tax=Saponaria officinalis TaxID=3572 RepID=A0AAW1KWL0_SAPOF
MRKKKKLRLLLKPTPKVKKKKKKKKKLIVIYVKSDPLKSQTLSTLSYSHIPSLEPSSVSPSLRLPLHRSPSPGLSTTDAQLAHTTRRSIRDCHSILDRVATTGGPSYSR